MMGIKRGAWLLSVGLISVIALCLGYSSDNRWRMYCKISESCREYTVDAVRIFFMRPIPRPVLHQSMLDFEKLTGRKFYQYGMSNHAKLLCDSSLINKALGFSDGQTLLAQLYFYNTINSYFKSCDSSKLAFLRDFDVGQASYDGTLLATILAQDKYLSEWKTLVYDKKRWSELFRKEPRIFLYLFVNKACAQTKYVLSMGDDVRSEIFQKYPDAPVAAFVSCPSAWKEIWF